MANIGSIIGEALGTADPLQIPGAILSQAKGILGFFRMDKTVQAQIEAQLTAENIDLEKAKMANDLSIAQGQLAINLQEAKNNKLFDDWRDAVGWTCAIALFWNYVGQPFGIDIALLIGAIMHVTPNLALIPKLDLSSLYTLLGTMLATGVSQFHANNGN